jgi:molybdenum cofactor biosynthesis protein B
MTSSKLPVSLNCCVLTVSDTRTIADDTSGGALIEQLSADGHRLGERTIVKDDRFQIRAVVSRWIADPDVDVILTTGGTGFTGRDSTPEAIAPRSKKSSTDSANCSARFRSEDWYSTIQSRALGGLSNGTLVFCMPGSKNVQDSVDAILHTQLDVNHKPCNFVELIPRFDER